MTRSSPFRKGQLVALTRAFVARFFENDVTGGSSDLKSSFVWLIAFLAPLGILMPWTRLLGYEFIFLKCGPERLRLLSIGDKTFYLGLGIVAAGLLAVITWNSLLIDRRDALVLGALPVSRPVIVRAKLAAIAIYVGLLTVGMHLGASMTFGLILSRGSPFSFVARGIVAHFVASCLGSLFMLFSITAVQAVLLVTTGPRIFARVSPMLQIGATAIVLATLLALPAISSSAIYAGEGWSTPALAAVLRACVPGPARAAVLAAGVDHSWVLAAPPAWFLGVYEWILGTDNLVLRGLATRGFIAVVVAAGVTVGVYPLAARRLMVSGVEGTAEIAGQGRLAGPARWLARAVTRVPATRACAQFLLATVGRVDTHRFTLALAGGAILAFGLPVSLAVLRSSPPTLPSVALLSVPLVAITFSLVGLRIAAALPGQIRAGWIFLLIDVPAGQARAGLRRVMFVLGVVPSLLLFVPVCWWLFDADLALTHAAMCLGVGTLLTETLLWGFAGVPCARPWRPERANLRTWWPAYLAAFLLVTQGAPRLTLLLRGSSTRLLMTLLGICAATLAMHLIGRRQPASPPDDDELVAAQVLNLD